MNFNKNETTNQVPRELRGRKNALEQDELIIPESKNDPHKTAIQIRVTVFGDNRNTPDLDVVKRRIRQTELFGRASKEPLRVGKGLSSFDSKPMEEDIVCP